MIVGPANFVEWNAAGSEFEPRPRKQRIDSFKLMQAVPKIEIAQALKAQAQPAKHSEPDRRKVSRCHLSWQVQNLVMLQWQCHFSGQAQYLVKFG